MGLTAGTGTATGLVGQQNAPEDLGYLSGLILVPKGSYIATDTLALLESTWLDNINSVDGTRYIVLPLAFDLENNKEEAVYETSSLGNQKFVRPGKLTRTYMVTVTPVVMEQLNTLNSAKWNCFEFTSNNFMKGTSPDRVKFSPFTLDNFRVEGEEPAGGDTVNKVPITFTYGDPSEWNGRPSFIQPLVDAISPWNPNDLKDPKAIISTVTNATTAGFDIYLQGYDKVPFEGAVKEDVIVRDASTGVVTALTSLTESTPGQYAAVGTIAASTYEIGAAPVGTSGATQGYAGLQRDLQTTVIV